MCQRNSPSKSLPPIILIQYLQLPWCNFSILWILWNIHIHLTEIPTPQSSSSIRSAVSYEPHCQRKGGEWLVVVMQWPLVDWPWLPPIYLGLYKGSLGQLCFLWNSECIESGTEEQLTYSVPVFPASTWIFISRLFFPMLTVYWIYFR